MKAITASLRWLATTLLVAATASAQSIAQINGDHFLSPYSGQTVSNVTGVVTAKGPDGIWIRSVKPGCNKRVSNSLYVYGSALAGNTSVAVGDVIVLNGKVSEYRSSKDYIYMTELGSPKITAILETGKAIEPLVIGQDTLSPPTSQYSGLDGGDVFAVPNNQSLLSVANPQLQPDLYGLDFWESLMGELVTIESPRAIGKPNQYGDTWVVGDWNTTGDNDRTGLTVSASDGNPEGIIIGSPLDGSSNPTDTKLGDRLDTVTGVVFQAFGFYRILPLTNLTVIESLAPQLPSPTTLTSEGTCAGITVGGYNIENFYAGDTAHAQAVANHIVSYMRSPDLLAVQEIQDDNGVTDDGTVGSDATLTTLVNAISALGGAAYNYTYISPVDDTSGGAPGGNIRVAYLYRPEILQLRNANPGDAVTANEVLPGPELKLNPGYVDPANKAWTDSRKPLAAAWELADGSGKTLFTVNVHWGSKGGSSSLHGDARPPVNGGVDDRQAQAEATAVSVSLYLSQIPPCVIFPLTNHLLTSYSLSHSSPPS